MTSRTTTIATEGDKTFQGYLALPEGGKGPGLLLPPEIYGVVPDIRALADRFAEEGYVVLAPDILWRNEPGREFAYTERESAAAVLGKIGGLDPVADEIVTAFDHLRGLPEVTGKVGVVTFGFGTVPTQIAVIAGTIAPDAGVSYFGGRITDLDHAEKIAAPWQFHFAEEDAVIPPAIIDATRDAFDGRSDVEVHAYPGARHGFAVPSRVEYDRDAGEQAFGRARAFLEQHLKN